jgi:protein-S-isoprenylcysteine O-methyltransferase Ste14
VIGLAFAVWARFSIGRNWDGLVALKENHQLMRSGPYAIVRHPIYSGFMLATFGTAMVGGKVAGLVSTALIILAWGYKSRVEEEFMIKQFGAEYEQYRHDVKALIPLIW